LSPGAGHDVAGTLAVHLVLREAAEAAGPLMDPLEILHREIDVVRNRTRLLSSARGIEERKYDGPAVEVVARPGNTPSFRVQQSRVEIGCLVQVGDLQDDAENARNIGHD